MVLRDADNGDDSKANEGVRERVFKKKKKGKKKSTINSKKRRNELDDLKFLNITVSVLGFYISQVNRVARSTLTSILQMHYQVSNSTLIKGARWRGKLRYLQQKHRKRDRAGFCVIKTSQWKKGAGRSRCRRKIIASDGGKSKLFLMREQSQLRISQPRWPRAGPSERAEKEQR